MVEWLFCFCCGFAVLASFRFGVCLRGFGGCWWDFVILVGLGGCEFLGFRTVVFCDFKLVLFLVLPLGFICVFYVSVGVLRLVLRGCCVFGGGLGDC